VVAASMRVVAGRGGPSATRRYAGHQCSAGSTGWAETAALIGALRCVVTVDTGVAHLAGALGADVHLALHMEPTPYWKVGAVDSPWYPSVRVYQGCRWASVVARIAAALG
jgi:ADP-heptose:LPS heptosyltransferase